MQSHHLTRRVFRAILNNEPLHLPGCRHRSFHTIPSCRTRKLGWSNFNHVQRRGLFAFNMAPRASEQQPATLPTETGLTVMRDLMRSLEDKSRGPSNDVLAKAFQEFLAARAETPGFITGFQAHLLLMTWEYLRTKQDLESKDWAMVFSTENLENLLFVLSEATCLKEAHDSILKIARSAFQELCADHGFGPNEVSRHALLAYINLLALNGNPGSARRIVEKFRDRLHKVRPSPWLAVIKGFALEDNRTQIKQIAVKLERYNKKLDCDTHEEMIKILIEQRLMNAVQIMYECPLSDGQEPTLATKEAVIKYAISKYKTAWAQRIFESLSKYPIAETMGISMLWEAAHGKTAFDISEKVKSWTAGNPEAQASLTISCVNDLIALANSMNHPQKAREFATLASEWDLHPDSQTKILQLESCVLANDVSGALRLMRDLPDLSSMASEHLPLMNKLITMLCWSGQQGALFNQVSSLLDPLFENNVRLEGATIAALTHLLLYRHDWEGVSELLRPRLGFYESEDKAKIRNVLTDYILDSSQNIDNSWEVYNLLKIAFPETGVEMRTNIMASFFERGRSDLACLVFGHMRQAEKRERRPKPFTYARCFQGISLTGDAKNLDLVHNMLKLDVEVDVNTQIRNALMLAYASCDMADKSMAIFREILQSEEGPSLRTVAIFFKTCETHHNGVQEAMKMMKKAKELGIGIDRRMYTMYIVALAAHCEFDLATEAVEKMQAETGYEVSRKT